MEYGRELERFIHHTKSADAGKRALVVEPTYSHQEVIPSLVYYFNRLGFGVDVLLTPRQEESRKIEPYLETTGCDVTFFYTLDESIYAYLAKVINNTYEIVYFNTLFEKYPNTSDHRVFYREIRARKILATIHSYQNAREDFALFPNLETSSLFVLNPYVSRETGLRFLSPSTFFREPDVFSAKAAKPVFLCVGEVHGMRRDYDQLIDAGILLRERGLAGSYVVNIVCPKSVSPYSQMFKANIKRYGLNDSIHLSENLPFDGLFSLAARTPYMLFLLNKRSHRHREYLNHKITGGINISLGFGIVPVVEAMFAEHWGMAPLALSYEGVEGLADVIAATVRDPELYSPYREKVIGWNEHLRDASLENLAAVLGVRASAGDASETGAGV